MLYQTAVPTLSAFVVALLWGAAVLPAQEPKPCPPDFKLDSPPAHLDRTSILTIRYNGKCAPADAAKSDLTIDGLPIARRLAAGRDGQLNFTMADASTDPAEAKILADAWQMLSAFRQPVDVTIGLRTPGGGTSAVLAQAKLYARPLILGCVPRPGEAPAACSTAAKGDTIELAVTNLDQLRAAAGNEPLYLYLDRKPMGLPLDRAADPKTPAPHTLRFQLTADGTPEQVALLLPSWRAAMAEEGYRDVPYGLAIGTAAQILTVPGLTPATIRIRRLDGSRALLWFAFVAGVLGVLVYLGIRSELLRESCPPPPSGRRAYSLAKVQMAFWFALILVAVVLYWVVLNEELSVPANLLALMGISGGTYVLARAVDDSKDDRSVPVPTSGFLRDLLTSANGVELHRFQILVWTLVFGLMMIREFALTLVLPDPSATSLTLMGMSSGVYVSLKIPEKKV